MRAREFIAEIVQPEQTQRQLQVALSDTLPRREQFTRRFRGSLPQWRNWIQQREPGGEFVEMPGTVKYKSASNRIIGSYDRESGTGQHFIPVSSGSQSRVSGRDPGTVVKRSIRPETHRPETYTEYIEAIRDRMAGNPYFPYAYEIQRRVARQGGTHRTYFTLQRLTPLSDLDWQSLLAIYERMGQKNMKRAQETREQFAELISQDHELMGSRLAEGRRRDYVASMIVADIRRIITEAKFDYAEVIGSAPELRNLPLQARIDLLYQHLQDKYPDLDPLLLEPCAVIVAMIMTTGHKTPDVSSENLMARLTSVGPQLVFTDPII